MTKGKKENKEKVTKDMLIIDVLRKHPQAFKVFLKHGMTCIGCPIAMSETVEQGASAHDISTEKLVEELNKKL